jgi:hypothetical protein
MLEDAVEGAEKRPEEELQAASLYRRGRTID